MVNRHSLTVKIIYSRANKQDLVTPCLKYHEEILSQIVEKANDKFCAGVGIDLSDFILVTTPNTWQMELLFIQR
jgi:hypothetical protein